MEGLGNFRRFMECVVLNATDVTMGDDMYLIQSVSKSPSDVTVTKCNKILKERNFLLSLCAIIYSNINMINIAVIKLKVYHVICFMKMYVFLYYNKIH